MFTLGDRLPQIAAKVKQWNRKWHKSHLWNSLDLHLSSLWYIGIQIDVKAGNTNNKKERSVAEPIFIPILISSEHMPFGAAALKSDFAILWQKIWAPCNACPPHPSCVAVQETAWTVPHTKKDLKLTDALQTALSCMTFSWCCHNIVSSKSQLLNLCRIEVTPGVSAHMDNYSERRQRIVGVGTAEWALNRSEASDLWHCSAATVTFGEAAILRFSQLVFFGLCNSLWDTLENDDDDDDEINEDHYISAWQRNVDSQIARFVQSNFQVTREGTCLPH